MSRGRLVFSATLWLFDHLLWGEIRAPAQHGHRSSRPMTTGGGPVGGDPNADDARA